MGVLSRLYRGETRFDFIGTRKWWYLLSVVLLLVSIVSPIIRGFNWGIEFAGGNQFQAPANDRATLEEVRGAVEDLDVEIASAQEAGRGDSATYIIRTGELNNEQRAEVRETLADELGIDPEQVTVSEVSSSWGSSVTERALWALAVFMAVVMLYLWIRFEQKMALAALAAVLHDLILTAGIYSLIGFEVTPSTVIGMLTILGYSLYDTVVVFDKVQENTRGLLGSIRQTYGEAANLAVNQTLMRSINTSLIGLLPVAGLLFIGAGLLGVGTLNDLALVLFIGMLAGAYSSLFIATPILVDLKRREPRYRAHEKRILARREAAAEGKSAGAGGTASKGRRSRPEETAKDGQRDSAALETDNGRVVTRDADSQKADDVSDDADSEESDDQDEGAEAQDKEVVGVAAPRPGARPVRKRPARNTKRSGTRRKR